MIGGFVLAKWAKPPKISTLLNITLWICSVCVQFLLVFGTWDGQLTIPQTAIYVSVGHTAWGLSLMWMVVSCYWGMAPPINKLLSYRAFLPLSRLTYCTYLLHPMIMVITSFRMEAPFHLQHVLIVSNFIVDSREVGLIDLCPLPADCVLGQRNYSLPGGPGRVFAV